MMPWFCNTAGRVGARMHANAFGKRSSSLIFPKTESRHGPSEGAANIAHRCGTVKAGMRGFEAAFASVINNSYVTDFTHHHAYQPRKAAAFQHLAAKRISVFITGSCRVIDILLTISRTCKSTEIAFFRLFWQVPSRRDVCSHVPLWPTAYLAGFTAGSKPKGRGPADPRTCRHFLPPAVDTRSRRRKIRNWACRQRAFPTACLRILAQVSRRVTVRLKTGLAEEKSY